ncbi:MAG: hypothetical protein V7L02_08490 [Nostoc sp.]|uniref:hypothetical protein n=1 Tax=Nostoc sp. TaxID=1180 RepID=UPI002FFAE6D2
MSNIKIVELQSNDQTHDLEELSDSELLTVMGGVLSVNIDLCPPGFILNNGACSRVEETLPVNDLCPRGFILSNGSCLARISHA